MSNEIDMIKCELKIKVSDETAKKLYDACEKEFPCCVKRNALIDFKSEYDSLNTIQKIECSLFTIGMNIINTCGIVNNTVSVDYCPVSYNFQKMRIIQTVASIFVENSYFTYSESGNVYKVSFENGVMKEHKVL